MWHQRDRRSPSHVDGRGGQQHAAGTSPQPPIASSRRPQHHRAAVQRARLSLLVSGQFGGAARWTARLPLAGRLLMLGGACLSDRENPVLRHPRGMEVLGPEPLAGSALKVHWLAVWYCMGVRSWCWGGQGTMCWFEASVLASTAGLQSCTGPDAHAPRMPARC